MAANDKQVAGSHYAGKVQHWDMVVMHQLNYFEGQITKYVMRARKKNGKQDLEKAAHFLEKYLEVYDDLNKLAQDFPPREEMTPTNDPKIVFHMPELNLKHILRQFPDRVFSIEGHSAQGQALYKCRSCGAEGWYETNFDAHQTHGSCAGRGYVAQG